MTPGSIYHKSTRVMVGPLFPFNGTEFPEKAISISFHSRDVDSYVRDLVGPTVDVTAGECENRTAREGLSSSQPAVSPACAGRSRSKRYRRGSILRDGILLEQN